MKALIVGGSGGIGAYIARELRQQGGHEVTIGARKAVAANSPVADFPLLVGDYVEGSFTAGQLEGFDTLIFTAAADIRGVPHGSAPDEEADFYRRANSEAVPEFFRLAKQAGIRRAAYVGSFYPQAKPELVGEKGYVRSRKDADEGARSHASDDFHVVSLNAPWVVGTAPGLPIGLYDYLTRWALGMMPQVPLFAPPGGSNYITVRSVCEAVLGGLERGENGRGYLIGDANMYFKDLFEMFFRLVGRDDVQLEVRDEQHPILTDGALFAGRAATIFYEPEGVEELGYTRHDVEREAKAIVAQVRAETGC
jgi:nucleoside-diphosphate-sugar epimerase